MRFGFRGCGCFDTKTCAAAVLAQYTRSLVLVVSSVMFAKLLPRKTSQVVKLNLYPFTIALSWICCCSVPGSAGGFFAALSVAVQRFPEREVLPGDYVVFRAATVVPPLQGPEECGKNGYEQGVRAFLDQSRLCIFIPSVLSAPFCKTAGVACVTPSPLRTCRGISMVYIASWVLKECTDLRVEIVERFRPARTPRPQRTAVAS